MTNNSSLDFLEGGGEMGTLLRARDWASTSLGAPTLWPQSLRTAVRLMLNTGHPMYIFWGPEGACFYNDAYRQSIGLERHPSSLGRPAREVWEEIWDVIGPQIDQVMTGRGATWHVNQLLPITRNGRREDVYWTYSYGPIDDEQAASGVGGVLVVCTETTEQVEATQRVERSEQRLQLALSAGRGIGTWDWDVVVDRVVADERFARLYGVDPAEARAGAPIAKFFAGIHPNDLPGVKARVEDVLRTGSLFCEEYRLVNGPGERWVVAEGRCEFSSDGTPVRFPGISFDITERKLAEKKLQALNADLERKVIEKTQERGLTWQVSPDLLGALNSQGYFETSNPAWQVVLGWSEDEVASMSIFELLHPDDVERTRVGFNLTQQGQPAIQFPNRYRCKDGNYRWISWVGVPEGRFVYCSGRDITVERLQAEELAARTLERDTAWAASLDLLAVVMLDGTFTAVNRAWTKLLGWREDELIGRPFSAWTHPDDLEQTTRVFEGIVAQPLSEPYEYRLRHKDGSYRWFAWTASMERGLIYGNGRDTTVSREQIEALRLAEDALRQSQKMEAVGQLTGGLAHDFNNLLTGISGSLEFMQNRMAQGRMTEVDRHMVAAQGAVRRAAALTHRLLAFSRRQTLDPKPTNANRLVMEMEELIRRTVGPAVHVEVVGAGGLWSTLVDPNQLENSLLNLCINARDAMPDGGRLTIETANKWLDEHGARQRDLSPGQYVSVCVTDTGTGMAPDVVLKAFDPFFTTKPLGQGTGLGLSMVYGFARQSGGAVRVYSELGQGTTMCLYLPRYDGDAETDEQAAAHAALSQAGEGKVIIVIDDEPVIRTLVVELLEESGYTAISAPDGPSGLRLLQATHKIDLLITDVGLPGGMNGRQVADAARVARPDLKVLFITGYAENAVVGNGHLEKGMAILTKPFVMDDLALKVHLMIGA